MLESPTRADRGGAAPERKNSIRGVSNPEENAEKRKDMEGWEVQTWKRRSWRKGRGLGGRSFMIRRGKRGAELVQAGCMEDRSSLHGVRECYQPVKGYYVSRGEIFHGEGKDWGLSKKVP